MPRSTLKSRLRAAAEREQNRHADVALLLKKYGSTETLLCAGGRWDFEEKRWARAEPESAHVIEVGEGQEAFIRWGASFLRDFRQGHEIPGWVRTDLTRVILAESGRRAGKTHALQAFQWAMAVDLPLIMGKPLICWAVHVSHQEEEEYFDNLRGEHAIVPTSWYTWRARPQRFELIHGSYVQMISADDERTTKRGKVDVAFVNEAQKQRQGALTNLIYGTADRGGITMLAANPNDNLTGEWVAKLRQDIISQKLPKAKSFYFDPKKNPFVDQVARSDVDDIVRHIDPRQAARDGGGLWLPITDHAYHAWSDDLHLRPMPEVGGDITNFAIRKAKGWNCRYEYIAGLDFQRSPGCCASIFKLYGDPADPILHAVDEVLIERGSEFVLSDELYERGYDPDSLVLIADATGQQQDYEHSHGHDSYSKLRSRGWHVERPQPKRSTKGKHSINPPVKDRLALMNEELAAQRILVDPERAPILAHCLKECILKPGRYSTRVPGGEGWLPHHTDGAGYVVFWLRPPPARVGKSSSGAVKPQTRVMPGSNWWPE